MYNPKYDFSISALVNQDPYDFTPPNFGPRYAAVEIAKVVLDYYEMISGISEHLHLPESTLLYQNYPNPFNPTTNIDISIPKTEFVTLKIYNPLGQQIKTIVSDKLIPGNYKYTWNASGFASGIYYYHLKAGDFEDVKKMVLIR